MSLLRWTLVGAVPLVLVQQYVQHNDSGLNYQPPAALKHTPRRYTEDDVLVAARRFARSPVNIHDYLPPRTGRRYIVVGGAGFVGGWMVLHLLARGEDPKRIRILDIRPPVRKELTTGLAAQVSFFQINVTNAEAVNAAFSAPWPEELEEDVGITVFHTAALIRFYERHESLVSNSAVVNVRGTQNVIAAARSIGATALVFTSSGSIAVRNARLWLWPWEKFPQQNFVQVLRDDDSLTPTRHEDFFSNYAVTKVAAEGYVREADGLSSGENAVLRTGCVRPGNGIFGPGGDVVCEAYLVRKQNPCFSRSVVQSHVYVENVSLAHLCYEQRLIELSQGMYPGTNIGGQSFMVTDPGPPPTMGDVYFALETLDEDTTFMDFSPTILLFFAHIVEMFHVTREILRSSSSLILRTLARFVPRVGSDLISLQPSTFSLIKVHLIFDDSRACLPAKKGGIGYRPAFTTLEGICKTVEEYHRSGKDGHDRSMSVGINIGFIQKLRAQRKNVGKQMV